MDIIGFLVGLAITILLFLLFRVVVLWYWKIGEIVKLLTEIRDNTKK